MGNLNIRDEEFEHEVGLNMMGGWVGLNISDGEFEHEVGGEFEYGGWGV